VALFSFFNQSSLRGGAPDETQMSREKLEWNVFGHYRCFAGFLFGRFRCAYAPMDLVR